MYMMPFFLLARHCRMALPICVSVLTLSLLAGCASDSASMEKDSSDYVITGIGDDQNEAMENARQRALEQCEEEDRDEFVIVDQETLGPGEISRKSADADDQLRGATVNEDTELEAAANSEDSYKAIWTIRCR